MQYACKHKYCIYTTDDPSIYHFICLCKCAWLLFLREPVVCAVIPSKREEIASSITYAHTESLHDMHNFKIK